MSTRASGNLKKEMENLRSVPVSEVESVQQELVDVVRQLEDSGEISRPTGDEEEEYVNRAASEVNLRLAAATQPQNLRLVPQLVSLLVSAGVLVLRLKRSVFENRFVQKGVS